MGLQLPPPAQRQAEPMSLLHTLRASPSPLLTARGPFRNTTIPFSPRGSVLRYRNKTQSTLINPHTPPGAGTSASTSTAAEVEYKAQGPIICTTLTQTVMQVASHRRSIYRTEDASPSVTTTPLLLAAAVRLLYTFQAPLHSSRRTPMSRRWYLNLYRLRHSLQPVSSCGSY